MKKKQIKADELYHLFKVGLQGFQLTSVTVEQHTRSIRHLIEYMEDTGITIYTSDVGELFLKQYMAGSDIGHLPKLRLNRAIVLLNMIANGDPYKLKSRAVMHEFPGEVGRMAREFINHLRQSSKISESSSFCYGSILNHLSIYMDMRGIVLYSMNHDNLAGFFSSSHNSRSQVVMLVKRFLQFLYEEGKTRVNLSCALANARYTRKEKLPSYYDKDEILKIESVVDRTSPIGKRDYAIILLASRLGLRASDIVSLTFANLDWDNSLIILSQQKTKKDITLPLLPEVGNAIIDYIRDGRPQANLKTIFLTAGHPYRKMSPGRISTRLGEYINKAGISTRGRHKGCHSLRHSLAMSLLQSGASLPVIKECLGHESSESTMCYLAVNIPSLLDCSLDVPPVEERFYRQRGGIFYEK
jgi:site-specific recombinase XerD